MNKQVEANLSMIVSKALGGFNMNALKYLLPLWIAPVTGVTFRLVFGAAAFGLSIFSVNRKILPPVRDGSSFVRSIRNCTDICFLPFRYQYDYTGIQFYICQSGTHLGICYHCLILQRESNMDETSWYRFGIGRSYSLYCYTAR